jgi:hypothetical protein
VDRTESTRAVLTVDVNGDGWLDLVSRELAGETVVFQAQCGAENWLKLRLVNTGANVDGVGSRITVNDGERSQNRWITLGATGLQSSREPEEHLGLADATTVEVRVRWPDGEESVFEGVGVNQTVRILR